MGDDCGVKRSLKDAAELWIGVDLPRGCPRVSGGRQPNTKFLCRFFEFVFSSRYLYTHHTTPRLPLPISNSNPNSVKPQPPKDSARVSSRNAFARIQRKDSRRHNLNALLSAY